MDILSRYSFGLFIVLGLCQSCICRAHDFWVQPKEYRVQADAVVPMTLQVGHGAYRQRSPISLGRITRFEGIGPDGSSVDLRKWLRPGDGSEDGAFQFKAPGTYLLVLETDNKAQSHLPAIRFNDYLRAEGLTPALEQRSRTRRMDADGSECYSRRAKAIVQVGDASETSQSAVTEPVGLPLEIVPEVSPYSEPRPTTLPVRVLYHGQRLARALVKLTQLEHDAVPFETHWTDAAGRAVFNMPGEGTWLLNVIWTTPLPSTSETDFETVFSSLSFGFPVRQPVRPSSSLSALGDQGLERLGRMTVSLPEG